MRAEVAAARVRRAEVEVDREVQEAELWGQGASYSVLMHRDNENELVSQQCV